MVAKNLSFAIAVATAVAATFIICIAAAIRATRVITFCASYYFVCYRAEDNAVSASSISDAVSSYGGAGYILNYDDKYYITVACYYDENDAITVNYSLARKGLDCSILVIETQNYHINSFGFVNTDLYLGNLNTLNEISHVAYECANGLDSGNYNQSTAKSALDGIYAAMNGLKSANADNCFSAGIDRLITVYENVAGGHIYSKDARRLQIAIIDFIISVELY